MRVPEHMTPDVPAEVGHEHDVFFTRGAQEYRISQEQPGVWIIQRRGTAPEDFHIRLENRGRNGILFDATIRARAVSSSAIGQTLSFIIAQFC